MSRQIDVMFMKRWTALQCLQGIQHFESAGMIGSTANHTNGMALAECLLGLKRSHRDVLRVWAAMSSSYMSFHEFADNCRLRRALAVVHLLLIDLAQNLLKVRLFQRRGL